MQSERVLIEAARCGDRIAAERLLTVCQRDIRRYAWAGCVVKEDVDDVVQEVLWIVYHRIETLRTAESFTGWLFAIVRRECYRLFRRKIERKELCMETIADNHPAFAYYFTTDIELDIASAIYSLPDKYKEAIILRYFEGFAISDIASECQMTQEAVKSRIHRGRNMVREYFTESPRTSPS